PDARDGRVIHIDDGAERVRLLLEFLESALASDAGKPGSRVSRLQHLECKPRLVGRRATGLFHFGKRAPDAQPERCGTGDAGAEQTSLRIFDARAAAGAATVDADEQRTGWCSVGHPAIRWIFAPHCTSLRSSNS